MLQNVSSRIQSRFKPKQAASCGEYQTEKFIACPDVMEVIINALDCTLHNGMCAWGVRECRQLIAANAETSTKRNRLAPEIRLRT